MHPFRSRRDLFLTAAILLTIAMAVNIWRNYRSIAADMAGSAPPSVAFFLTIPYGLAILLCLALAWRTHRRGR